MVSSSSPSFWKRYGISPPPGNATYQADYKKWYEDATQDSVLDDFLTIFKEGTDIDDRGVTQEELWYFNGLVAGLGVAPDGQVLMPSIIKHIANADPAKRDVIERNAAILEALTDSYACFPFSNTVPLTKDAFCRAAMILSNHGHQILRQSCGTSYGIIIRSFSQERKLKFVFSTIAYPPIGISTHDDVVDVLARLPYPAYVNRFKHYKHRRLVTELSPLAERLDPAKPKAVSLDPLPIAVLKPLEELVAAFPPHHSIQVIDSDRSFGDVSEVSLEEFVEWGIKANLIDSLHRIYGVFFRDAN